MSIKDKVIDLHDVLLRCGLSEGQAGAWTAKTIEHMPKLLRKLAREAGVEVKI